jgi:6-pyruvoyltetrahydropterin/6-carboxytetrahydropterin synthase
MIYGTRKLEFDAGHRLKNHDGKCANYHGHRYTVELTIGGDLRDGMILDFGVIKRDLGRWLDDHWDHGMILEDGDPMITILNAAGMKCSAIPVAPTAENMALLVYETVAAQRDAWGWHPRIEVSNVRVYETPNCWADYSPGG